MRNKRFLTELIVKQIYARCVLLLLTLAVYLFVMKVVMYIYFILAFSVTQHGSNEKQGECCSTGLHEGQTQANRCEEEELDAGNGRI